jgi:hypothetical protein
VIDYEPYDRGRPTLFRVRLDEPVEVPNVGVVRDDLWERAGLKTLRERAERGDSAGLGWLRCGRGWRVPPRLSE